MVMATQQKTKALFVILILLTVIPLAALHLVNTLPIMHSPANLSSSLKGSSLSPDISISSPGPDLGITNWTHNHIENSGFEDWSGIYNPDEWDYQRNSDRFHWFATQPPDHVSQGTYSAGLQTRPTPSSGGWAYWYQDVIGADMRNLTLSCDWYVDSMASQNYDYFMVLLTLTDGRQLRYYVAGGEGLTLGNHSTQAYFVLYGGLHSWDTLSRNVTADYLDVATFPGSISAGLQVYQIYFYLQTGAISTQWLRAFFDDVQLYNETTIFIGGSTRNGDLENYGFNPWYTPGNNDASHISQSTTAYSGTYSCNLTSASVGNSSLAEIDQTLNVRITNQNLGEFSVAWHLNQTHVQMYDYSMLQFRFRNATSYFSVYYVLSHGDTFPYTNDSVQQFVLIDGFNTTETWQLFQCNLWQDMYTLYGRDDALLDEISLQVFASYPTAWIELLVDDIRFNARAVSDADYEDQGDPGTLISGWNRDTSPNVTVTDQGFGGGKAANCSLINIQWVNLEHDLNARPLNGTRETYFDVMWRFEAFDGTRAEFRIEFENGNWIYYVLGSSIWGSYSNGSICYFNATGSGTVGSWIQLHRDLVHDYEAAFGSPPDTTLTTLSFFAMASVGSFELLFDDLYIYDDPAPRLSNHQILSGTPNHNDPVHVQVNAEDQDLATVILTYTNDSGTHWYVSPMTHHSGTAYRATIPGYIYGTYVHYYFEATDTWGMTTRFPIGVLGYSVDDTVDPSVSITSFNTGDTVSGMLAIDVTATDGESGMERVDFRIDGTLHHTDYTAPYSYTLNTSTLVDGDHNIAVSGYDNAANMGTDYKSITTDNGITTTTPPPPPPPPIPGFPLEALFLGVAGAIGIILVIRRRKHE
jgi:hypothetical protein